MRLEDIRPFVRGASLLNWTWENRDFSIAYDCRIFAIHKGDAVLRTQSGEYKLKKGSAIFVNTAEPYQFRQAVRGEIFSLLCINLDLTQNRRDIDSFVQPDLPSDFDPARIIDRVELPELMRPLILPDESGLADKVYDIYQEYHSHAPYCDARLSAMVIDFIISAVRLTREGSSRRSKIVASVKSYVNEHYAEKLTNEDIAAALGYHPYYLSRIFNNSTGTSLHRYLLDHRLHAALHMLAVTSEPIEAISIACGFSSPSHFTSAFKAKYGRLPSSYRKGDVLI